LNYIHLAGLTIGKNCKLGIAYNSKENPIYCFNEMCDFEFYYEGDVCIGKILVQKYNTIIECQIQFPNCVSSCQNNECIRCEDRFYFDDNACQGEFISRLNF